MWRPVTAAPENHFKSQLAVWESIEQYLQLITQAIQNTLPILREVFVRGEYKDMKAGENLLECLGCLLLGPGRQAGRGCGGVGQQAPERGELHLVILALLNILLKQSTEARWQEVCRLKICRLIIISYSIDKMSSTDIFKL